MPQAKIITLNDAATTPVEHAFVPSKIGDLTATFFGPGASLAGRESLTIDRREASSQVASRVNYVLRDPFEKTVDGVVAVDHQNQLTITAIGASTSTKQERADLWAMGASLFANADAKALFVDGEGLY